MKEKAAAGSEGGTRQRAERPAAWIALVVAGIVLGQVILVGPSLIGQKILLPLDFLAMPGVYLPSLPHTPPKPPHNRVLSDLVLIEPMAQQFTVSEFRAGRWPMWTPNNFCGTPFLYSLYSPFKIPLYCSTSPYVYAWPPFLLAIFTGLGAYFFCRRVLQVGSWPATIAGWCWPLTGFFAFWMGYNMTFSVGWLPWLLWAVDAVVRRQSRWAGIWLAPATCLTVVSGQFDVGAQVLFVSGLYAVWCFLDEYGRRCFTRQVLPALATIVAGWGLGFALGSVYMLPMLEYSRSSSRLERRSRGEEERPPIGPEALPQMVIPDMYGSTQEGYLPMFPRNQGNQQESSAAAYTGLLATLLLMPLAWCSRRHRSINLCWTAIGILGASWCLDLPALVDLLRLPGLNMLSHNRLVFATSFCILAMMAIGLDVLWRGDLRRRWWFWAPMSLAAVLMVWCLYRTAVLPEPLGTELRKKVQEGWTLDWIRDMKDLWRAQDSLIRAYAAAAALSGLAVAGWFILWYRAKLLRRFLPVLAALLLADLVWFGYGRPPQCDRALYYPRIPALEQVAKAEPGRIIGCQCLPAMLGQSHDLRDVRGYDGVDPTRIVELLQIAADPRSRSPQYATTQWLTPWMGVASASAIRLRPVLDMLDVRYVIFRGDPPEELHPEFSSPDYWVMKNPRALPRVFVPEHIELAADKQERLAKLAAEDFNPRQVAYVEEPVDLPSQCRGAAEIVEEIPTRIKVSFDMQTPGLVVLADRWDAGWHAYCDGKAVPILQTNHAVRGVVAPAGKGTIEFRYEPTAFAWSLRLAGMALLALAGWGAVIVWSSPARRSAVPDHK